MSKLPKKADKAIELLDGLVEQLHYFYGNNDRKFKTDVLKDATDIENILKDLAVNKKETFKRIARKYSEFYKKKRETMDITDVDDTKLNDSLTKRYKQNTEKDRE